MFDSDALPFIREIFDDQAAVAVFGCVLTAQQASIIEQFRREDGFDLARCDECEELPLIVLPSAFCFLEAVQKFLSRSE